jgi:hypothetical protein
MLAGDRACPRAWWSAAVRVDAVPRERLTDLKRLGNQEEGFGCSRNCFVTLSGCGVSPHPGRFKRATAA